MTRSPLLQPPVEVRRKPRRLRRALRVVIAGTSILLGTAAFLYFALVTRTDLGPSPRAAASLPAAIDIRLRCANDVPLEAALEAEIQVEGHRVLPGRIRVRRPGVAEAHDVRFQLYFADGVSGPAPVVVITPILGGRNDVSKIIADDLAGAGMHAVIVDRRWSKGNGLRSLPELEEDMRDMVADRRRVIDWLLTRPEIDPARIAAYGVSLGGITTVCLAAAEPRVRASIIVMAGGDLPAVLCRSVEKECVALSRENGVPADASPEQLAAFEASAREILETEPLTLAQYIDPGSVLLFITRRDTSVPTFLQERLREGLGRPETFYLPTGHYSAVAYLPVITSQARAFLERRLR